MRVPVRDFALVFRYAMVNQSGVVPSRRADMNLYNPCMPSTLTMSFAAMPSHSVTVLVPCIVNILDRRTAKVSDTSQFRYQILIPIISDVVEPVEP